MEYAQINTLTLNDTFFTLLPRLVDLSVVPENDSLYEISSVENDSMYDRVTLNALLTKPALSTMLSELEVYKVELTVIEDARLVEVARIADLKARWSALDDAKDAFQALYPNIPNAELWFQNLLKDSDKLKANLDLIAIEMQDSTRKVIRTNALTLEAALKVKLANMDFGRRLIALFSVNNDAKALTDAQIIQIHSDFSEIKSLLESGNIITARVQIIAIVPNTIVTQVDIDYIVAQIDAYLG